MYAKWQINQYTIAFVTNGGSAIASILADYNSAVSEPLPPYRTGYSFVGWFSDVSLITPYTFTTMPLDGITLYAKWELNEVTITFVTNGGSSVTPITQDAWTVVSAPESPARAGSTFLGWFIDMDLTMPASFPTTVTDSFSVYAKWEINQYTITFAVNGGSSVAPIAQNYDTAVTAPADPTKSGFIFAGWYVDNQYSFLYAFDKMPAENVMVYARWEVDPLFGTISIADFKATTDGAYHEVAGTVLFAPGIEMGIIVVTDDTGILVVESTGVTKYGDFVKVGGTLNFMIDYPMMSAENLDSTLVMILGHDRPIPIEPTPMTIADYNALDPNQSSTWINYLEIAGTLTTNALEHTMSLVDGTDTLPLLVTNMEIYQKLVDFDGFELSVRGISLPNPEAIPPVLMFVLTGGPADIKLNYTDAELVALIGPKLADYFSSLSCFPGQYVDLPTENPIISFAIAYETFGPNAGLFDLVTGRISPLIETEVYIDIRATITIGSAVNVAEFQLHVVPLNFTTVANFLLTPDAVEGGEMTYYYLKGTVIHLQLENGIVMIADETGIVYVGTSDSTIRVGDEIVAYGVKTTSHGMTFIVGNRTETILTILSSGNALPLTRTPISLAAFLALDVNNPANSLVYFSVTGLLSVGSAENLVFIISDGISSVPVLATSAADYASLLNWVGLQVTISGLSTPIPEQSMMLLVFINFPGDIFLPSA